MKKKFVGSAEIATTMIAIGPWLHVFLELAESRIDNKHIYISVAMSIVSAAFISWFWTARRTVFKKSKELNWIKVKGIFYNDYQINSELKVENTNSCSDDCLEKIKIAFENAFDLMPKDKVDTSFAVKNNNVVALGIHPDRYENCFSSIEFVNCDSITIFRDDGLKKIKETSMKLPFNINVETENSNILLLCDEVVINDESFKITGCGNTQLL